MKMILKGVGASRGIATGRVILLDNLNDAAREKTENVIVVSEMISPSITTLPTNVKGIITDEGGILSHAAIIARELRIPCIVGTAKATSVLKEGMTVLVKGEEGTVYVIRASRNSF